MRESERRFRMLQKAPLFWVLKPWQLRDLLEISKEISYEPGSIIVQEGKRGIGFYLVLDGRLSVSRGGKTLALLKDGDFFGEMALLDDQPRSATVEAVTETNCLVMSARTFLLILESNPKVAVRIINGLAQRLRTSDKALSE